jgi:type IV pilus assembly protein PilP
MKPLSRTTCAALALGLALSGCGGGDEGEKKPAAQNTAASPQVEGEGSPGAKGTADPKKKGAPPPQEQKVMPAVEFTEADFVESEDSRDPFHEFSALFVRKTRTQSSESQRKVKASSFALDELKLSGIISRGRPSVMLTDPSGFGWILYTGDFVGKPELIATGGTDGQEVAINWRVDRIRPTDVVFIREDSTHPDIPPTTRVIPLYPTGDEG